MSKTYAYITNIVDSTVSVIDTATDTVVVTIPITGGGYAVAVNSISALTKIYVADTSGNKLNVIDAQSGAVEATITITSPTQGVAVTPDGLKVYVSKAIFAGEVIVVDALTNAIIGSPIPVGQFPSGMVITPDGSKLYVANDNNLVYVIDVATDTVITTIGVGTSAEGVAINPAGTRVYVTNFSDNTVSVINTATDTVVTTISIGIGNAPFGIGVNPNGLFAYVGNRDDATVSVINTATNLVVGLPIAVGTRPRGISFTPDGAFAYVVNELSNNVSVINTTSNLVVDTISVGSHPISFGLFIGTLLCPTITLSPSSLANGIQTHAYNQTVTASGGTAPYTYAVTSGGLPPGLSLNANSGQITGNPGFGIWGFTITATDANGCTGSMDYTITVTSPFSPGGFVRKSFNPSSVTGGTKSTLTISILNPGNTTITGIGFTDIFPMGLIVASSDNLTNNMGGTPTFNSGSLSLTGGSIGPGQTGIITIDVTSNTAGSYVNNTGAVISDVGNLGSAGATLIVTPNSSPSGGGGGVPSVFSILSAELEKCPMFIFKYNRWYMYIYTNAKGECVYKLIRRRR